MMTGCEGVIRDVIARKRENHISISRLTFSTDWIEYMRWGINKMCNYFAGCSGYVQLVESVVM